MRRRSLQSEAPTPSLADTLSTLRSRRTAESVEDDASWWSVTFGDFVLIILCFFVLWHIVERRELMAQNKYATLTDEDMQENPVQTISPPQSLSEHASPPVKSLPPLRTPPLPAALVPQPEFVALPQSLQTTGQEEDVSPGVEALVPAPILAPLVPEVTEPPIDASWQMLADQIEQYLDEEELKDVAGVVSSQHEIVISLSDTITFPSGEITLNSEVIPILEYVAQLAETQAQLAIEIAGHTDDRPIATSAFPSNWELSAARASSVARALLDHSDIDPIRLSTRSYAHYRPLYANDSDEHRAANRRVEIRFLRPLTAPAVVRPEGGIEMSGLS